MHESKFCPKVLHTNILILQEAVYARNRRQVKKNAQIHRDVIQLN